ncbi:hypothetical protein [Burkholderia glumae]|uniref:hypothetical protein n=1 Tax=Burkholderia glumae TaxID=337 RepID=UPI0020CFC3B0|nr:hypothetical protein [Burkholderia glumae]MCQ0033622.1 hypothetical protein [Burkholderia glumae]MCQ0037954.1 hypothetical protein [Burkholderia glumae]
MSAEFILKASSIIGMALMLSLAVALIAYITAYGVSRFTITWRNARTWEYIRRAVREYGRNHPEEESREKKRQGISQGDTR